VAGQQTYSTEEAAKAAGISKSTLLRWIKQGVVGDVRRDRNNWRVFTQRDVRNLKRIASSGADS
jgi:excisionase family DNA binding protein